MNTTRRLSGGVSKYIALALLLLFLAVMLFPFYIVTINSFKEPSEYVAGGPLSLPHGFYVQGIIDFWNRVEFGTKLTNSLLISLSVAVLGVALSLLNAFALGIGRVRGRIMMLIFFMIANTLPQESLAYPIYFFAKALNIYDTQFSVILVFAVIQSAFGTYLLSSVFSTLPRDIVEAAYIDGCTKLQLLLRIILPSNLPTLSVLFTFFFIWTWNEFFLPLILLLSNAKQTVPLAIATLQGQYNMDATMSSASALMGILPCIVFFILFQRTLTRGITAGSVK